MICGGNVLTASRVLAIEYQGSFVKVMLDATGTDEFVAYVPERMFFRDPLRSATSFRRPGRATSLACLTKQWLNGVTVHRNQEI